MSRIYNFSAGPARLPKAVMERVQAEFCDYQGSGSGIVELSHRGKYFAPVIERAEANIRELMAISDDYAVCFVQGGASMQFAMIPMNLAVPGKPMEFADTGTWSSKAIKEAKLFGDVKVIASSKEEKYTRIPAVDEMKVDEDAAFFHITSNNTIYGTQYQAFPNCPAGVPMLADMSSDIMSRKLDVSKFAMIYGGAQKNLGPSGMAVVIIRKDLAERTPANVPTMLRYATYIEHNSLFNTPPTFGIYIFGLITEWVKEMGGLEVLEGINNKKAETLYAAIDGSDGYFRNPVCPCSRSKMNVVFRLPSEELEAKFIEEAKAAGMIGLKGHRSVGGIRASIYNAMPLEGVERLVSFMQDFKKNN